MKKPVFIVAVLAMVLAAAAPAMTQTAPTDIDLSPVQESEAVQTTGDAGVDPATDPAPAAAPAGPTVGCGVLYNDPTATCPVDANGSITLPDGSTAPVLVQPDGTVFVQDANGVLTLAGQGASFLTSEGTS